MNLRLAHRKTGAVLLVGTLALMFWAFRRDRGLARPADYYTFRPPPVGRTYPDPFFGTPIKRISDARSTANAADVGKLLFITNEYSSMSPFNRDDGRLLLLHQSYFALYDGEGRFLRDLPLSASSEPRWSRGDPDVLFYLAGNRLESLNVATRATRVVHTFPEYSSITGKGESDICFDGDHLVLAGDGRFVFVHEISTGRKGAVLDAGGRAFDSLYITPDDNVTVTWIQPGTDRYTGIELFDRNMTFLRQVARAGGHMDVTRDADGREVMVWANAGDPRPICRNGVVKVRLADGDQTCLLSLDWSLSLHVSGPDGGGWSLVETYTSTDRVPESGDWPRYANELLQVSLDGRGVKRLAHHRSRPFDPYYSTPRAAVSRGGRHLVYSSNFGLQDQLGHPAAYTDAYLVDMAPQEDPQP